MNLQVMKELTFGGGSTVELSYVSFCDTDDLPVTGEALADVTGVIAAEEIRLSPVSFKGILMIHLPLGGPLAKAFFVASLTS